MSNLILTPATEEMPMPELPSHPDERRDASGLEPTRSKRRWVSAVWIAVVVVGVAIVVLHLAGVMGPGSH